MAVTKYFEINGNRNSPKVNERKKKKCNTESNEI
jgi:hypothetical protein